MKTTFLAADKPLTKSYTLVGNVIEKTSYPQVYHVTSIEEDAQDLAHMATLIETYGRKGYCLLKGNVTRPLISESRAGSTDPNEPTVWVCFDLDGAQFATPDDFMAAIGFPDASYIVQWSASHGIGGPTQGLRCHIIALLSMRITPSIIKLWLHNLNYSVPQLRYGLALTASGVAMHYPLDITTCQNDKLLFIAPPLLGPGILDPFLGSTTPRVQYVQKMNQTISIPTLPPVEQIRKLQYDMINALRDKAGLTPRRKYAEKKQGSVTYIENPNTAVVTGLKTEREFVYLNLNNGDSWAYYHPVRNPYFIYNFKGEPTYKTEELVPDYWASVREAHIRHEPDVEGIYRIAFRDLITSNYYSVIYDPNTNVMQTYKVNTEGQLRQWAKEEGLILNEVIPTWRREYAPENPNVIDFDTKLINTFQAPPHMLEPTPEIIRELPEEFEQLFWHVLGCNPLLYVHFLNSLAYCVQEMRNPGTAWILQGVPGTGKGVLFRVLQMLFGAENVVQKRIDEVESDYTGWLQNQMIIFIDEINTKIVAHESKHMAKLKSLITEPQINIRKMYAEPYPVINRAMWIMASNMPNPIEIHPGDRRFNVGDFQTEPRVFDDAFIEAMRSKISDLWHYLRTYPLDRAAVRTPLMTESRAELIERNRTTADKVCDALLTGNLEFLWDQLPVDLKDVHGSNWDKPQQSELKYMSLIFHIVKTMPDRLDRDQIRVIFNACVDHVPSLPTKFSNFVHHHGLRMGRIWSVENNRTVAGLNIAWSYRNEWYEEAKQAVNEIEKKTEGHPKTKLTVVT